MSILIPGIIVIMTHDTCVNAPLLLQVVTSLWDCLIALVFPTPRPCCMRPWESSLWRPYLCPERRPVTWKYVSIYILSLQWHHTSLMASQITGNWSVFAQFSQANNKGNIKCPHYWAFICVTVGFASHIKACHVYCVLISWRHHGAHDDMVCT